MTKDKIAMEDINKWNSYLLTQILKDVEGIDNFEEDVIWGKVSRVLEEHFKWPGYRSYN